MNPLAVIELFETKIGLTMSDSFQLYIDIVQFFLTFIPYCDISFNTFQGKQLRNTAKSKKIPEHTTEKIPDEP